MRLVEAYSPEAVQAKILELAQGGEWGLGPAQRLAEALETRLGMPYCTVVDPSGAIWVEKYPSPGDEVGVVDDGGSVAFCGVVVWVAGLMLATTSGARFIRRGGQYDGEWREMGDGGVMLLGCGPGSADYLWNER